MNKRYIFEEVPLTVGEAQNLRWEQAEHLRDQIRALYDDLVSLDAAPLPTARTVQTEVSHGDPGYEAAQFGYSPSKYQGDFEWVTHVS